MHFQSCFAPRMQYLSQPPPSQSCGLASVSEHLLLLVLVRLLLFFWKYLLLLHINMAVITRESECFPHQNLEQKKKKKRLHPHALPFTCLPLNGEQFPSRWQAIKGFTLLHLVKMLNKEVPFPPCSEREQAVLVLPREQISPWHDLPPASRSRAETATALLLHCTSPQRQSLLVSDVTIPSSPSRVCSTRWCSWKWAGSVCWEAWCFWSRRLRTACFWLCELQQPGSVAAIASDCKRLTWKRMGGCDLGLRQNWFCLTVEGSYPGTERWWDSSSFPTVMKPSYCQQK